MLVNLDEVLKKAKSEHYAVGLFNTHDTDMLEAALSAAELAYDTLISHRGESVDAPENTLPAYKTAVERGFGFECDVYLSKDGRVFTFHDRDLKRTTAGANTNKCADVTWDEIGRHAYLMDGKPTTEHAVSLPEALKVVGTIPEFWIDFKYFTPPFAEKVLAAFKEVGISEDRLMVATYSQPALRYMRDHHPSIRRIGHMDFMQVKGRWSPSFARAKGVTYAPAGKGEPMAREVVDGISEYELTEETRLSGRQQRKESAPEKPAETAVEEFTSPKQIDDLKERLKEMHETLDKVLSNTGDAVVSDASPEKLAEIKNLVASLEKDVLNLGSTITKEDRPEDEELPLEGELPPKEIPEKDGKKKKK